MTHFKTVALFFKLLAALTLALLSLGASAEPYFIHKDGAMVLDKATGLQWMRCSLGQKWNGSTCTGQAKASDSYAAQHAAKNINATGGFNGHSDWRLPTVPELLTLRLCSTGFANDKTDIKDGGEPVNQLCNRESEEPTLALQVFPSSLRYYRTSSPFAGSNDNWVVGFSNGYPFSSGERPNYDFYVRLVRASNLSSDASALGFITLGMV